MSASLRGPLLALGGSLALSAFAVVAVHQTQTEDRRKMHKQVRADIEEERRAKCAAEGGPCEAKPPRGIPLKQA
jgi:hypothetical protein